MFCAAFRRARSGVTLASMAETRSSWKILLAAQAQLRAAYLAFVAVAVMT